MSHMIKDGTGRGFLVKVTSENELSVESVSESIQHHISSVKEQAYQVIGVSTLAASTVVALHVKNTSADKNLVVTYIRHQVVDPSGGTAIPNSSNYFRVALGRTYSAGGSLVTPVNVFGGSGNAAEVTAYSSAPTIVGTADEIDRWYTKAEADMNTFNKEGAVIVPPNKTMEMSYVGDQTGGIIYARLSFIMRDIVR